jgi:hypothetical protein
VESVGEANGGARYSSSTAMNGFQGLSSYVTG